MTRVGKIARLPDLIREQINRRLQDGQKGTDIIDRLNSMDEVKAILAREFAGRPLNHTNLFEWKQGGYRDWQAEQAALAEARRIITHGQELASAGEGTLGDNLATWVIGRYIMATRKLMETKDAAEGWKLLRELCHDVVALRRGEHGAEWLRLEQVRVKMLRQRHARERKKAKLESEPDSAPPLDNEELERRYRQIFGMEPAEENAKG